MLIKLRSLLWHGATGTTDLNPVGTDGGQGPTFNRVTLYPATIGLNLCLAVAVASAPFVQSDWAVPKGGPQRNADLTQVQSGLALTVAPIAQTNWPNPQGPLRNANLTQALSGLALTVAPVAQYDWPNPRGAKPKVADWADAFKLPLTTVVGANQYDWPVPAGARRSGDLGWSNSGLAQNTTVVYPAVVSFDWPNPLLPVATPRGASDSFKLPLQTIVGSNQYDWPVPKGYAPLNRGVTDSFKLPLQTTVGANQFDWPVPKGAKPKVADWTDSFKLPLTTSVGANQFNWPVPPGPRRSIELLTWTQTGFLDEVGEPFSQSDWPNPRGAAPTLWRGTSDSFKLPIQTIVGSNQFDWPVPRGAKPKVSDWQKSFDLPLTTVSGVNQYNWPVPSGARRSGDLGWTNSGLALNATVVYPATISFDYPNPRLPIATPRGLVDSFRLPLTTVVGRNQYDWPNPRGPQHGAASQKTWSDSFKLPLQTVKGFNQFDWPNPRGAQRAVDLVTWRNPSLALTATIVYPASPTRDWPNPRGATPGISLRTWIDTTRRQLIGQDALTTKRNNYEWNNPVLRKRRYEGIAFRGYQDTIPLRPITGLKILTRSLLLQTTAYNVTLYQSVVPLPQLISGSKLLTRSLPIQTTAYNFALYGRVIVSGRVMVEVPCASVDTSTLGFVLSTNVPSDSIILNTMPFSLLVEIGQPLRPIGFTTIKKASALVKVTAIQVNKSQKQC